MGVNSENLDYWRNYFRSSNSDIFDIIEHAITLAALDCPIELKVRRDGIAEKLFSSLLSCDLDRDCIDYTIQKEEEKDGAGRKKKGFDIDQLETGRSSKESKVNSNRDYNGEFQLNQISNYSYGEAEALTDEIEENNMIFEEVERIKRVLSNSENESDTIIFDSLKKLQLMDLGFETLQGTTIGKTVTPLRKHGNQQIRNLAKTLIMGWKDLVDEWVKVTRDLVAEATPESCIPSVNEMEEEEGGLPSPPLDDLSFLGTHTASMELSKFFDGMDEDGNPQNSGELNKNRNSLRKPCKESPMVPIQRQEQVRKEETVIMKQQRPILTKESEPRSMIKQNVQPKLQSDVKIQPRMPMKPQPSAQIDKPKVILDDKAKLEATKRKLHESYKQAENAKKQRTIQMMDINDLPKQSLRKIPPSKPGNNNNRNWRNGFRR